MASVSRTSTKPENVKKRKVNIKFDEKSKGSDHLVHSLRGGAQCFHMYVKVAVLNVISESKLI